MKYALFVMFGVIVCTVQAQVPLEKNAGLEKLAPQLQQVKTTALQSYSIAVADVAVFKQYLQQLQWSDRIIREYLPGNIVVLHATYEELLRQILPFPGVRFVDHANRQPQVELSVSGLDLSLNKVNLAHQLFPHINGAGLTASLKEERFDEEDIDFAGRHLASPNAASRMSAHASIMATILGGGGNSYYNGKGAAWGAALTSTNFNNLLPEDDYQNLNITVQNHSYGVGIENYYGVEAVAYDASVLTEPTLLHVFSAGNRGTDTSATGIYKGVKNAANLTGAFKMAKNVVSVGSLTSNGDIPALSSKGPAYDGRVKPELVALGQDGSSGAAALTSGVALLLQQAHNEQFGEAAPAALVKAVLINSADDVAAPGIDFQSGYGNVNAWRALQTLTEAHFFNGLVQQEAQQIFEILLPENACHLKITLVWSDVPAPANAARALVNDLDLELHHENQIWLPWVLNTFPHPDSLSQLPKRQKDHINNVEQISIENPSAGIYQLKVKGFKISTDHQSFHIVYQWDTLSSFHWTFPLQQDPVEAGAIKTLRWETSLTDTLATVEYALNGGNWQTLATHVPLQHPFLHWQLPDTSAQAQLRMTTGEHVFLSDPFQIDRPLQLKVGFYCEDDFMLFWNPVPHADGYRVYALGDQYLQALTTQTDTFLVLKKSTYPATWYAVEPLLKDGNTPLKSYAINYTTQGVGCYIRDFAATLEGDAGRLHLSLGTPFGLKRLIFEKRQRGNYVPLQTFVADNQVDWQTMDTNLVPGVNTYRAKLELANGDITYSEPAEIWYPGKDGYEIFPNPVAIGQPLWLLSQTLNGQVVRIFDALGREVQTMRLNSEVENLETKNLPAGAYQVVVFQDQKPVHYFKLILLD